MPKLTRAQAKKQSETLQAQHRAKGFIMAKYNEEYLAKYDEELAKVGLPPRGLKGKSMKTLQEQLKRTQEREAKLKRDIRALGGDA